MINQELIDQLAYEFSIRDKRIAELEQELTLKKNDYQAGYYAGLEAAAQVAGRIAEMMESGAGEIKPGERLRQVERSIRTLKEETT